MDETGHATLAHRRHQAVVPGLRGSTERREEGVDLGVVRPFGVRLPVDHLEGDAAEWDQALDAPHLRRVEGFGQVGIAVFVHVDEDAAAAQVVGSGMGVREGDTHPHPVVELGELVGAVLRVDLMPGGGYPARRLLADPPAERVGVELREHEIGEVAIGDWDRARKRVLRAEEPGVRVRDRARLIV